MPTMFEDTKVRHGCRAALQCVNRCLNRLCKALGGSFHLLQPSTSTLFASLQQVASNISIDGIKIEGNNDGETYVAK